MLHFSANLSMLFVELPLLNRFEAAKKHGFKAVEIQFPYELSAMQIKNQLQIHDLKLVLFNVAADDLLQGGEGLAAVPQKQAHFNSALEQAMAYAELLNPEFINILPGCCHNPIRLTEYQETFKRNLRLAADTLSELGVTTVFEAINSYDMPGFMIDTSVKMLSILNELSHPNLRLQYDVYHMCRMQEDCADFFSQHLDKIGHIQFADCPGRGQPGTGTTDFARLFHLIETSAYQGWLGAEYKPVGSTASSLDWLKTH